MRLDREPRSSLGDTLLPVSLKALTTDQPSAELMTPAAACEPLCANQSRAIMPMLDVVDITPVQKGDQSRGVVIPRPGGPGGAAGGHGRGGGPLAGRGGVPVGGSPTGSRSGAPAGGQGAPLVVLVPRPPARANPCASSLMMMRYHLTRTSLCRSGCGNFTALGRWCLMRRLWLTWNLRTRGPRRRPRQRGFWRRGPWWRPQQRQWLPRLQELPGAHRPPARRRQWQGQEGCGSKWLLPAGQTSL
jgi:hypothetical protein